MNHRSESHWNVYRMRLQGKKGETHPALLLNSQKHFQKPVLPKFHMLWNISALLTKCGKLALSKLVSYVMQFLCSSITTLYLNTGLTIYVVIKTTSVLFFHGDKFQGFTSYFCLLLWWGGYFISIVQCWKSPRLWELIWLLY